MTRANKEDSTGKRTGGWISTLAMPWPVGRPARTGCSKTKSDVAKRCISNFSQDFYWEHCTQTISIGLIESSFRTGSSGHSTPVHDAAHHNTPCCVYLG